MAGREDRPAELYNCSMWRVRATLILILAAVAIVPLYSRGAERGREADLQSPLNTLLVRRQNQAARAARGLPELDAAALRTAPGRVNVLALPDRGNIAVVDNGDGVELPALGLAMPVADIYRWTPLGGTAGA